MSKWYEKWYRGYVWVAIGLLLPGIARLTTAPTTIDAILFYVIGVVVWGTVFSAILFAFDRFRKIGKPK